MTLNPIVSLCCGAVIGIITVISCSDDSPSQADAAACDCPAAEKPLAGRLMVVESVSAIQPGDSFGASVACPTDTTLISGGCRAADSTILQTKLLQAGFRDKAWTCLYKNDDTVVAEVKASAICLTP